jgi:K+ transporter
MFVWRRSRQMIRWRMILFRVLQRRERSLPNYLGLSNDRVVEVDIEVKA